MKAEGWIVLGSDGEPPLFITSPFRTTMASVDTLADYVNGMEKLGPWAKKPYRVAPATLTWKGDPNA